MEIFHFVTHWSFRAPMERVWGALEDIESWPAWWRDWKSAVIRGGEKTLGPGSTVDCRIAAPTGYALRFSMRVTAMERPRFVELESTGDLAGTGRFVLEPCEGGTAMTFHWDVGSPNPVFNVLAKTALGRALFEKNHAMMMYNAFRALRPRVEAPAA